MHTLYIRQIMWIFVMWDYLSLFLFVVDMAQREASDRVI